MSGRGAGVTYNRESLLFGAKREAVLELWEVQQYGVDSYGDPDYVSLYGMSPSEGHARGVRLLGRSAVECTRDPLARAIATDVAALVADGPSRSAPLLIDPFAGSGNTLHWLQHELPGSRAVGFELDPVVCELTNRNLRAVNSQIDVANLDSAVALAGVTALHNQLMIAFVAPPWGDALDPITGLDLRLTEPPAGEVMSRLIDHFAHNPLLLVVQVVERLNEESLTELTEDCDWSSLRLYDLGPKGQNHGVLLCTRGWSPPQTPFESFRSAG